MVFCSSVGILATRAVEERKDLASLAPEFALREVDGEVVSLSSLRGQVVILIFCSANERKSIHCSEQIIQFANAYSGDSGVQILSIDPMVHGIPIRSK